MSGRPNPGPVQLDLFAEPPTRANSAGRRAAASVPAPKPPVPPRSEPAAPGSPTKSSVRRPVSRPRRSGGTRNDHPMPTSRACRGLAPKPRRFRLPPHQRRARPDPRPWRLRPPRGPPRRVPEHPAVVTAPPTDWPALLPDVARRLLGEPPRTEATGRTDRWRCTSAALHAAPGATSRPTVPAAHWPWWSTWRRPTTPAPYAGWSTTA